MEYLEIDKRQREGVQLEFKKAKGGLPKSFFETYSAFSNTKGGFVYLGLEQLDDGTIVSGMLTENDIEKIKVDLFSLLNDPKKVSVNLIPEDAIRTLEYDGYPVLEIKIAPAPAECRPVFINNNIMTGTYRRNGDGDYHCSVAEIKAMLRDSRDKNQDLAIVMDISVNELSSETIASYKSRFRALHPEHVFLNGDDLKLLEYIGAVRVGENQTYHPTVAGLLMFGYSYKIVYEFPEYFLDYQEHYSEDDEIRWTDRMTSDSGDWSGNLYDFYVRVVNKMTSNLKVPFQMEGLERIDETPLHQALREALCNAISNADFNFSRGLVVKKYSNRIEFQNPGSLRISAEKAFAGGESDARNKTILKMFGLVGVGERAGSGVPKILRACETYGLEEPKLFDEYAPDRTTLIIRLDKKEGQQEIEPEKKQPNLTEKERMILSYLLSHGESKAKDISANFGYSVSTAKQNLYRLMNKGLVQSKGSIKNRRYSFKNSENI